MIHSRADRVVAVTEKFKGRLEDWRLEDILNYVDHDEWGLAFDLLCDFIAEFDIPISIEEYDEIIKLAEDMEFDMDDVIFKHLKKLING